MDRELDANVARAMGTTVIVDYHPINGNMEAIGWYTGYKDDPDAAPIPHYSSDPTLTPLLLAEIERRGLEASYIAALWAKVGLAGHNGEGPNIWKEEWILLRATPEQHARAFIAVCKTPAI